MQKISFPLSKEEEGIECFWNLMPKESTANKSKSVCMINNHSYWILCEVQSLSSIQLPAYHFIPVLLVTYCYLHCILLKPGRKNDFRPYRRLEDIIKVGITPSSI